MRTLKIYLVTMLMMSCKIGFGQLQSGDVNGELRVVLGGLSVPTLHSPFFYDFVAHATDEKWFVDYNVSDTSNFANWYTVFDEMKYSAHDTSLLPNTLTILRKAESISRSNEVPIGILNADFDMLKTGVLNTQGVYFTWDDNYIYDVVNRTDNPYESKKLFIASVLNHNTYFKDVKFRISPDLIFHNSKYKFLHGSTETEKLYIDFGDGNGWIYFDDTVNQTYDVKYPKAGDFEVKFAYFNCDPYPNCSASPIMISKSYITVLNDIILEAPSAIYDDIPGITYGIYEACNPSSNKKLIFLEGFDMFNSKSIFESYAEFFTDESVYLKSVRAYDYDVVVVNWNNSTVDIRENATSIVRLIEKFKQELNENENEQFVIVGNSLGGIVGRLTLNYMESKDYEEGKPIAYTPEGERELITPNYIKTQLMHNTRLLISFDSGLEGVYVPVSTQHALKKIKDINSTFTALAARGFFPIALMVARAEKTYQVLQSMALKQLLIYHINNYKDLSGSESYQKMVEKYDFDQLVFNYKPQNNGMPEFCKVMTFSSGLISGERQTDWFGKELAPNYNMANVEFNLKKRIFRLFERQVFNMKYTMNALPDYQKNGTTFNYTATYNKFILRGCLRKLISGKGDCVNTDIVDVGGAIANNTIPYEIISGGNVNVFKLLTDGKFNSDENDFFLFAYKYKYDPNSQSVSAESSYGLATPKYTTFSLTSDALIFNFIPVYSAFDIYPKNNVVELDLYHTPNFDIFKSTGSDVISGLCRSPIYPNSLNGIHSYVGNSNLKNGPQTINKYNRVIQREIGDDFLYLDNFKLNRDAQITIHDKILLGEHNTEYEYIQAEITPSANRYFLSRNEPLEIMPNGKLTTVSNNSTSINTINCSNCIIGENVFDINTNLIVCANLLRPNLETSIDSNSTNEIKVFPNPTNTLLNINSEKYKFTKIVIKNELMNTINSTSLNSYDSNIVLDLSIYVPGVYVLEVFTTSNQIVYKKIIKIN